MGDKLNFRETKKELDRRIEKNRNDLNNAYSHSEGLIGLPDYFKGKHDALVEFRYTITGGEHPPEEKK